MKLQIGTHLVKIQEKRIPSSENCDGMTDWDDSTILVEKNLTDSAYKATLVHEILEFINECTERFIFNESDEYKEQKISTLAELLIPLIKDNILQRDSK